jgi:PAS domain S-box-containing protein
MTREPDGAIRYWSDGCTRLYGWTAEQAVGQNAHQLLATRFPLPLPDIEAALRRTGEWTGDLRHRSRDGRDLVVTAYKLLRRSGKTQTEWVLEVLTDVTAQRRAEAALRESQSLLRMVIETAPGLIYAKDNQGRMILANAAVAGVMGKPWAEVEGRTDRELLDDPAEGEAVMANDRQVMDSGTTQELEEVVTDSDGQPHVWLSTKTPMRDQDGTVTGLIGVSLDITERKRMEERLQLMVHELNHRVKNTLATVQAIASQTLGGANRSVYDAFEGRLLTLAAVHDVLTSESWKDASLEDVARAALGPQRSIPGCRLQVSGPPLRVRPAAAVVVALALHELVTNAMRFGALSGDAGQVTLAWSIVRRGEPCLTLLWTERDGPSVHPPARRGFGTRLIERSLARDLRGEATIDYNPDGVVCTIEAPLREVAASPRVMPFLKPASSG